MEKENFLPQESCGGTPAERRPWFEELPALSGAIVEAHYTGCRQAMLPHLDPHVVWLGAMEGQYADTAAGMLEILEREKGIGFEIQHAEYRIVYADDQCATVFGVLRVHTAEDSGLVLAFRQRITFQYLRTGEGPKAVHIHVSNDWQVKEANEELPFRAGKETYRYVQEILRRNGRAPEKLSVRDIHHHSRIIVADEIIFAEAEKTHCILHCVDGTVEIHERFDRLAARLPKGFVRVHRSYVVNSSYVIGLKRFAVLLCDGYALPVPERGYTRIKKLLWEQIDGMPYEKKEEE